MRLQLTSEVVLGREGGSRERREGGGREGGGRGEGGDIIKDIRPTVCAKKISCARSVSHLTV